MSYETAVARMYELGHELTHLPSHKFDLAHVRTLLSALRNPETRFPGVLIGGTNGKGSTAATLAAITQAAGLRTGLYTSPHLVRMNERIRIDADTISDDDFAAMHGEVDRCADKLVAKAALPWHPSFFEMMTAIAFQYFASRKVDLAVIEVGMGGRLDATNVVEPRLSVITDISLDHQKYLGNTLAEIAKEKAGILRRGGAFVTLPQAPDANRVLGEAAMELDARGISAVPFVPPVSPVSANYLVSATYRYPLEITGEKILVESPLLGRHQLRNIALAIAAAQELRAQGFVTITPQAIERGIKETRWAGRFQIIAATPTMGEIVLDAAHNPAGAWALRSAISERYGEREPVLVFGAMLDKAIAEMAEILFPVMKAVVVTPINNPRTATPEVVREAGSRTGTNIVKASSPSQALERAKAIAGEKDPIIVAGSIYLVGEIMQDLGLGA